MYLLLCTDIYDIDGLVKAKPFHLLVHLLRKEIKPTGAVFIKNRKLVNYFPKVI